MINADPYINGEFVKFSNIKRTINPATMQYVTEYSEVDEAGVDNALTAAENAFRTWSKLNVTERASFLKRAADYIDMHRQDIADLITDEEGKTIAESLNEVNNAYKVLYYYYGEGRRVTSYVVQSEQDEVFAGTIRMPLGIVYVVSPFNSPFSIPFWNIAPALLHGNSVIFKPSSITTGVGHMVSMALHHAGIPPGVFNTLFGNSEMISQRLLNSKSVQAFAFTGGTEVGNKLSEINGRYKRRQILELGGKDPAIVCSDANLDLAVSSLLFASFSNAGQRCTAGSRIIIEEKIYDDFKRKFIEGSKKILVGYGKDKGVKMGPVAGSKQYSKVKAYIDDAIARGVAIGTDKREYSDKPDGYFIYPTIFTEVDKDDVLFQDEIFGPVAVLTSAKDVDEAFDLANHTKYGLVSAIYTTDIRKAFRAIDEIDAGVTFVNQGPTGIEYSLPYLGHKESGFGEELGLTSIMNYTKTKSIYIDYSYNRRPFFWDMK
ncbi:aldehyde dehydrogenase family protein [Thermoplasma sp.]|uniref:aldehyde dehydrogenase family protein n=1 Tax=Thermoplasma sp. TaxID=1973142 RepID=UPI002630D211|nr:aldehyde dehydrogenase family protein [Thermoplasma sp.]